MVGFSTDVQCIVVRFSKWIVYSGFQDERDV